jgi:glycosyltransferase involved in cell wall biosynthesis
MKMIDLKINKVPLVTIILFAYNQEQYIREAIKSMFSQTYSNLEIILSDDCSFDNTFNIMKEMANNYKGRHNLILIQNKVNLGLIKHVNKVITEKAKGEIIVISAGDDISFSNRVEKTLEIFNSDEKIYSVSMNYKYIDKKGDFLKTKLNYKNGIFSIQDFVKKRQFPILGCTRAYKKELFDLFPKLDESCGVEDSNLVFRSLLLGKIYHTTDVGIYYRTNIDSMSKNLNHNIYFGILKQRKKDLEYAFKKNIIDVNLVKKIELKIESQKIKHNHIKNLFIKKYNFKYYFKYVLFSNHFDINEKIIFFKTILKINLCNH